MAIDRKPEPPLACSEKAPEAARPNGRREPLAEGPTQERKMRSFIIAEDTPSILSLIKTVATRMGHTVKVAVNGLGALDHFKQAQANGERVDAVITDIRMPQMDGFELIDKLRETDPGLPIVIIAGALDEKEQEQLRARKVIAIIAKPFRLQELMDVLDSLSRD